MKAKKKRQLGRIRGGSLFSNLLLVLLVAIGVLAPGVGLGLVIIYSWVIPTWLYILLICTWFGLVMWIGYVVYKRIDLRRERYLLGDDAFFRLHPREWKREVRRWHKVDTYRVVAQDISPDELPALLQIGYEATSEDIASLGLTIRSQEEANMAAIKLLHDTPYDELYYRAYPKRLNRKLYLLKLRRAVSEKLSGSSKEPTLYERRLEELKAMIEQSSEVQ